jgi:mitotic spindle assembly checkpoint protein MAD2
MGLNNLLIYSDKDLIGPEKWEEAGLQFITSSEEVHLPFFTATISKETTWCPTKVLSVTEGEMRKII